ncbi:MAG: methyl-accepting chemotaxis protein, partial [Thiotrichales bacterium]|nr:methyl-accepting chemotaxis protein [Thiotrichales bacterium]
MKRFNELLNGWSIRARLFINTFISVSLLAMLAYVGYTALSEVGHQTTHLATVQQVQASQVSQFQQAIIQTTQLSSEYSLTRTQEANQAFNTQIDALVLQVEQLASSFTQTQQIESMKTLAWSLAQYKNATNSSVFLEKEILQTYKYGIEPASRRLESVLVALQGTPKAQDSALKATLEALKSRLTTSQVILGKMMSSRDTALMQAFNQDGLGLSSNALLESLSESLSADLALNETVEEVNAATEGVQSSFADIKDYVTTVNKNNLSLIELVNQANQIMGALSQQTEQDTVNLLMSLEESAWQQSALVTLIGVLAIALVFSLNALLSWSIIQPLRAMKGSLASVVASGELHEWRSLKGNNELVDMSQAIQQLIGRFEQLAGELQTVGDGLSNGEFHQTISQSYVGEFERLKISFNHSVGQVASTMSRIQSMSQALEQGDLSFNEDTHLYRGGYRQVVERLSSAITMQKQSIESVKTVMLAMNKGDFSQRITLELPGDFSQIKAY